MLEPALMRLGTRQLLRTKKFLFAALVSLVPILIGILTLADDVQESRRDGFTGRGHESFTETVAFPIVLGTVPFVALMLAGGHLADEAEDRTLTYLLVRPVKRSTLYLSRYVPVALAAVGLAVGQVLALGIVRLLAAALVGTDVSAEDGSRTYGPVLLVLRLIPTAMLAVALEALVFTALFGLVSLITTRFHFFVNLVLVGFDAAFGSFGGAGLGGLAVTYWVRSFLQSVDPTVADIVPDGVGWPFVPFWLVGWFAVWLWLGARRVGRRDFNITSAAT